MSCESPLPPYPLTFEMEGLDGEKQNEEERIIIPHIPIYGSSGMFSHGGSSNKVRLQSPHTSTSSKVEGTLPPPRSALGILSTNHGSHSQRAEGRLDMTPVSSCSALSSSLGRTPLSGSTSHHHQRPTGRRCLSDEYELVFEMELDL